jgi:hypothetical protein
MGMPKMLEMCVYLFADIFFPLLVCVCVQAAEERLRRENVEFKAEVARRSGLQLPEKSLEELEATEVDLKKALDLVTAVRALVVAYICE